MTWEQSRLVALGKASRATLQRERRLCGLRGAAFTWSCAAGSSTIGAVGCASARWVHRKRGHSATPTEARPVCCPECGDELCDATACRLHTYESFLRSDAVPTARRTVLQPGPAGGGKRSRRSKSASGKRHQGCHNIWISEKSLNIRGIGQMSGKNLEEPEKTKNIREKQSAAETKKSLLFKNRKWQ